MSLLTSEQTYEILRKMDYPITASGKFAVEMTFDFITDDWEYILQGNERSFLALKKYLDQPETKAKFADFLLEIIAKKNIPKLENNVPDYGTQSKFCKIASDMIEISIPNEEKILSTVLNIDIGVDAGDSFCDYTANTVFPAYGAEFTLERYLEEGYKRPSIVWLAKQQGHTLTELCYALDTIRHGGYGIKSKLIHSIAYEVWHALCCYTQLYFPLKMTVEELLTLNSLMHWSKTTKKWGGYIIINQESACGFYSPSVGSGSLLEISLEKEVKLPIKYIDSALPDRTYDDYSIRSVYGSYRAFKNGRIVYFSLPKHFRRSMHEYGLKPIKKNVRKDIDKT